MGKFRTLKLCIHITYHVIFILITFYDTKQNVRVVLQGPVELRKVGKNWEFTANHAHENGEDITGEFEPVMMAIYKGDRSNFGVAGARFAIQPKGSRKVTEWIK